MDLIKKNEELIEKGLDSYSKGNFQKAESDFRQAYRFFKRNNKHIRAAKALRYLTDVFLELEKDELALDYLRDLLKIYEEIKDTKRIIQTLINLGRTYGRIGKTEIAQGYYKRALGLSNRHDYELSKAYIFFNIGEDLMNEGKLGTAHEKAPLSQAGQPRPEHLA